MGLNQAADGKRVASTALPHGRVAKQARVSTAGESAASGEQPTRDPTRASNDDVDQTRLVQLCGTYDQAFASMVSAQAACDAVAKVRLCSCCCSLYSPRKAFRMYDEREHQLLDLHTRSRAG
jgi:hypothetical protein